MDEYASIYWAAACLVFWAGCGVSDGQLADAVNGVCDAAHLTVPQEGLLKRLVNKLYYGGEAHGAERCLG